MTKQQSITTRIAGSILISSGLLAAPAICSAGSGKALLQAIDDSDLFIAG